MPTQRSRRHDGTRYFVGGRRVDEATFLEELALATAISAYDVGAYRVTLTPPGIAAALRLLEARRAAGGQGAGR